MSDMVASREIHNQDHYNEEEPIDAQDPFAQLEQLSVPAVGKNKSTKISTLAKKDVLKKMQQVKTNNEKLTLGFVLNILDGVLEVPGRVLIMTTNYIDKLDRALIRPGRIDLILDFKKTTRATIMEMYAHFYEIVVNPHDFENIDDLEYSPAEINQIFFRNIDNPRAALEELSR
jgi:SpoVK/Ycf46/Vps4 family AAA+-type ATPase